MDLTLPDPAIGMDEAIATLCQQASKDALANYARAKAGWRGDDARTAKSDIARAILEHAKANGAEAPLPALIEEQPAPVVVAVPVPKKERAPKPELFKAPDDMQTKIAAALAGALAGMKFGVDEDAVRAIIDERLQAIEPARIVVTAAGDVRIDERTHPVFEKVCRLVVAGVNVLLVGPAGCGKTHLAHQVAKALTLTFGTLHCTAGASESQLLGWLLPTEDNGRFTYVPAQFVTLYAEGKSLFLMDEIDAADPNMLMVLNGALANGSLHVPQRFHAPTVARGERAYIMAAANTFGTGADIIYAGRNQLDGATLDRFYVVEMGYDEGLEAAIAGRDYRPGKAWKPAADATPQELSELGEWVDALRTKVAALKLRRVVSTRTLQKGIAARKAGIPMAEVKRDLLAGWTRDELAKVGQ